MYEKKSTRGVVLKISNSLLLVEIEKIEKLHVRVNAHCDVLFKKFLVESTSVETF